jgi:hypothetical protein
LDALKDDLADPVGDRVCETMRVAREVGGSDLGTVLRTLSELLRSDARTRSELETRQGWVVKTAELPCVRRTTHSGCDATSSETDFLTSCHCAEAQAVAPCAARDVTNVLARL